MLNYVKIDFSFATARDAVQKIDTLSAYNLINGGLLSVSQGDNFVFAVKTAKRDASFVYVAFDDNTLFTKSIDSRSTIQIDHLGEESTSLFSQKVKKFNLFFCPCADKCLSLIIGIFAGGAEINPRIFRIFFLT